MTKMTTVQMITPPLMSNGEATCSPPSCNSDSRNDEDDDGPDDHPAVDVERRGDVFATLLQQRQQDHLISLNSSAKTRAARVAPSISAAVRIIAPRMSAEASGWRAIASTACPPMRPMPMPAPSSALLLSAVFTASAAGS